ncbi:MAG: hypothetical protein ACFFDN_33385 [Candidatus Hodarchaeota archaeon]
MRKYVFIIVIILINFSNCSKDKNPMNSPNNYSSIYFPLQVGNTWYYDSPTPQTNPWAMKTIKSSFIKNNEVYYKWTYGEGVDVVDNIRADEQGNIWNLKDNNEYLWFDFSHDSGSTYTYKFPESFGDHIYYYNVYILKNILTETPAGIFTNCIELFFDIPQVKDEEKIYTFAPDIGLVRLQNNGWSTQRLTSAILDSANIGN